MDPTGRIRELEEEIFTASELAASLRSMIAAGMKPLQTRLADDQLEFIEKRIRIARREMELIHQTHYAEIFRRDIVRRQPIYEIRPIRIFEFKEVEPEETPATA